MPARADAGMAAGAGRARPSDTEPMTMGTSRMRFCMEDIAVDMDITQLVDGNVGVHALCPKKIFADGVR